MKLDELALRSAEVKKLNNKGFYTTDDVLKFFPRKYYDFSSPVVPSPGYDGQFIALTGEVLSVSTQKTNGVLMLKSKVKENFTGKTIHVMWIGSYHLRAVIKNWIGFNVIIGGKFSYSRQFHTFHMNNPIIFSTNIDAESRIYPVYTKMSGISEDYMGRLLETSFSYIPDDEIPKKLLDKHKLLSLGEAYNQIHHPENSDLLKRAQVRFIYEDLLRFQIRAEENERLLSKGSIYNIKTIQKTHEFINALPFKLTDSQYNAFAEMKKLAADGRRINALVQGDVGSGKTMVAFLMMFSMADSGYQAALLAPTDVLARQHYEKLKSFSEPLGFKTVFLHNKMSAKERKDVLKAIEDGSASFIVGTHSLFSKNVVYKNLALSVIDEEHRFGVAHEEAMFAKSQGGMHVISMSATPIPRTLANAVYGSSVLVYDLERPDGRCEIQSAIFNNDIKIYEFIHKQIKDGRQCYVVCPLVNTTERSEERDVLSIEKTAQLYEDYFAKADPSVKIACVSGKTKAIESEAIFNDFKDNKVQILISTTVIEVGVDVPNASVIVINNAEYFGISQLHQLRGRVGRGGYKGYCIFKSSDKENERLKLLVSSNNGYELALEDAKLRGPGDLLGSRQSGKSYEMELILKYKKIYEAVKAEAAEHVDIGFSFK